MTENQAKNKQQLKNPQHVRIYFGTHGINIKETANPSFKTTDGDFIRKGAVADRLQAVIEAFNKNQAQLSAGFETVNGNFTKIDEVIADLEIRLEKIEQFMNDVVYPSHRKLPPENNDGSGEKVKESLESPKEPVEIHEDPEMAAKIAEIEEAAKSRGKGRKW